MKSGGRVKLKHPRYGTLAEFLTAHTFTPEYPPEPPVRNADEPDDTETTDNPTDEPTRTSVADNAMEGGAA